MRFSAVSLFLLPVTIQAGPVPKGFIRSADLYVRGDQPYGPNMGSETNSNWMSRLPDSVNLAEVSIPGTHDTMTYNVDQIDGFGFVRCQNADLDTQYRAGVRYVDIRCHFQDNTFSIYHSSFDTGTTFTDVIKSTGTFLDANPSECILMRVAHESGGSSDGNTRTFADTFNGYRNDNADTKDIFAKHFYTGDANSWPTVGECRGKFIVLIDFENPQAGQGTQYGNDTPLLTIEDNYGVNDIDDKWNACNTQLAAAKAADPATDKRIYMTYLSGSAGSVDPKALEFEPIDVAMGWEGVFGIGKYAHTRG